MGKTFIIGILLLLSYMGVYSQAGLHAYVFIAEECPICNYMGKPLGEMARKYAGQVTFHAVFPVKNSNYKTSQLFKEQYEMLTYETLLDKDQQLTKKLGATVTPEVVITDEQGEILYRGRINNAFYAPGKMKHSSIKNDLDEALAAITGGKKVSQPWPSAIGCYITKYAAP